MTNIKFSLNNKLNNQKIFNIRNFLLIFIPLSFLIFSFAVLYIQRNESLQIIHNLDTYIIIALVFIFILFVYLGNLIIPIILRVRRKKISSLNSKFTLYFISIALTPALIGLLGTILINMGINDWFN